jgi:tetratricopeptide (TPR) repeat protein
MRIQQRSPANVVIIVLLLLLAGGFGVFAQKPSQTPPGLAQEYYREGVFYGKQGKYVEAVVALEKAIALNPANADAYNALGVVYHRHTRPRRLKSTICWQLKPNRLMPKPVRIWR